MGKRWHTHSKGEKIGWNSEYCLSTLPRLAPLKSWWFEAAWQRLLGWSEGHGAEQRNNLWGLEYLRSSTQLNETLQTKPHPNNQSRRWGFRQLVGRNGEMGFIFFLPTIFHPKVEGVQSNQSITSCPTLLWLGSLHPHKTVLAWWIADVKRAQLSCIYLMKHSAKVFKPRLS